MGFIYLVGRYVTVSCNNREKQNFLFKIETTKTLKKTSIKILSELIFVDKNTGKNLWRQIFTYLQKVTRSVKIFAIGNLSYKNDLCQN